MTSIQASSEIVILHGKEHRTAIGGGLPLRLSAPFGCNSAAGLSRELRKIDQLLNEERLPDLLVDLSIFRGEKPLYQHMVDSFGGPVGFLPHYLAYDPNTKTISDSAFLREVERAVSSGISHLTLHITSDTDILSVARQDRILPSTSRGGGIALDDVLANRIEENVFRRNFNEIVNILSGSSVVVSLGSTFRPAATSECLDRAHVLELERQTFWAQEFRQRCIPVMREGLGHSLLSDIDEFAALLRKQRIRIPLMTLGPLGADACGRHDPIAMATAIGRMAQLPDFAVFQVISELEHAGGVPNSRSGIDAVRIGRAVADVVNSDRGFSARQSRVGTHRSYQESCVTPFTANGWSRRASVSKGCVRCDEECPLITDRTEGREPFLSELNKQLPSDIADLVMSVVNEVRIYLEPRGILLFGSTAKGYFSYSDIGESKKLISDIEMNVFLGNGQPIPSLTYLADVVDSALMQYGNEQPLFDIDIRVLNGDKKLPDYRSITRRELFCYSICDGTEPTGIVCNETDISHLIAATLHCTRSTLEWILLKQVLLSFYPESDQGWWSKCIWVSAVCKLSGVACARLGVPFRGTPEDADILRRVATTDLDREYVLTLRNAWRAKKDTTGHLIRKSQISGPDVLNWISVVIETISPSVSAERQSDLAHIRRMLTTLKEWCQVRDVSQLVASARSTFDEQLIKRRKGNELFARRYERHLRPAWSEGVAPKANRKNRLP